MSAEIEELATVAIDCGYKVHMAFGPGLLESVYEAVLADGLTRRGLKIERQKPIDIESEGRILREGFKIDILVEDRLIIELKSVERVAGVHAKQLLTYLRLSNRPLGLLMNFGTELFGGGVKRVSNNYYGDWKAKAPS